MLEAIVLAGGFGTRLRGVVPDLPKPMAPIMGRPYLEILLEQLADKGFGRIILSLGYMAEKISTHFGERFSGMELMYVVEKEPLGTGGATRLAMAECREDHVFIFNGDTFLDLEVGAVEALWQENHHSIIVGREVDDTSRYGRLLEEDGRATGFSEKGMSGAGLINAGCYVLSTRALDGYPLDLAFSLETDYLTKVVVDSHVSLFITSGYFIDIGVPEDYERAQYELVQD